MRKSFNWNHKAFKGITTIKPDVLFYETEIMHFLFFKIDFREPSFRDQISGDMGIWIKYILHTRENNTYFLFKVFYAPSTECEFNVVVVQLVLSKYICSIFHEPPTFATNRKQVSKLNRWMKENKWVSTSF